MVKSKILIMVEDAITADQISDWLFTSGYQVQIMFGYEDKPDYPQDNKPELILMDLLLKYHHNVPQLMSQINNPRSIPIVYLSPNSSYFHWEEPHNSLNILPMPIREDILRISIENAVYRNEIDKLLLENKHRYDLLIENAEDPIAVISYEGEFLFVNSKAADFLGMLPEDIIHQSMWDLFPLEFAESQMANIRSVIESGQGRVIEEKTFINGNKFWFSSNIQPIPIVEGIVPSVQLISRDITDIKNIERKLRSEQSKLKTITENSPFGLVLIDDNGDYIYMNPHFQEMCGYKPSEIPNGKTWFRKVFPNEEDRNIAIKAWVNDFKNAQPGEKKPRIFKIVSKNGLEKILHFVPVMLENGQFLMTVDDITAQRVVEKALKQSEEKFRTLAQTAVDAIIITDAEGRIVFSNRSLERIFDYNYLEIMGLPMKILIPDEYRNDFQGQMDIEPQDSSFSGNVFETYGLRKDGSEFPLEVSLNKWEAEGESYTTSIIRDITRRRLYEFKLKMREEIFQLMANNIKEVFWIIDPLNGQLIYMSPSYKTIWGQNTDTIFQNPRSWINSIIEEDRELFVDHIFGKSNDPSQWKEGAEFRLIRPDGGVRWILTRAFPVINENKEIYRRVGIATDITQLKKIESKLDDLTN